MFTGDVLNAEELGENLQKRFNGVSLKVSGYCHPISISLRVNEIPIRGAQ